MFCKKCGSEISEQSKFCPRCGAPIGWGAGAGNGKGGKGKTAKANKKSFLSRAAELLLEFLKRLLIALFVLLLFAAIGIGLWFSRDKWMALIGWESSVETTAESLESEMEEESVEERQMAENETEMQETTEETRSLYEPESEAVDATKVSTAGNYASKMYDRYGNKVLYDKRVWLENSVMRASSSLSADTYSTANLMDNDASTAWIEGREGDGVGESVTFYITPETLVYGFYIVPGYTKSQDLFDKNGMPTKVSVSDGRQTQVLDLSGFMPDFTDPLKSALYLELDEPMGDLGNSVTVTILEVRAGSKYQDTGFSELWPYTYETESSEREDIVTTTAAASTEVYEDSESEYVLPESDKRILTSADLEGLTESMCKLARNEIYARHGRKFTDSLIQAYFDDRPWYVGTIEASEFKEDMLSEVEKANRDLIRQYEEAHGYNK